MAAAPSTVAEFDTDDAAEDEDDGDLGGVGCATEGAIATATLLETSLTAGHSK